MNPQEINKDVTIDDLNHILRNILSLEHPFKIEIKKIVQIEGLSVIGHYIMTITNRAISINRGFVTLFESNNYQAALLLIRIQIDNCLRLFALSLYNNPIEFYNKVLNGEHIRNMLDRDGNRMTDEYLVNKIDKIFPLFKSLYKTMSGHIHFSKRHFEYNTKSNDNNLSISVGDIDELEIYEMVDYCFNMFLVGKDLLTLVSQYRLELKEKE